MSKTSLLETAAGVNEILTNKKSKSDDVRDTVIHRIDKNGDIDKPV
jgi:hypothetical protein